MSTESRELERCGTCGQFGAHVSRGGELVACDNCWELVCGGCMEYDPEEGEQCCSACVAAITARIGRSHEPQHDVAVESLRAQPAIEKSIRDEH